MSELVSKEYLSQQFSGYSQVVKEQLNKKVDKTELENYYTSDKVDEIVENLSTGDVDLDGYAKTEDVNNALDLKADKTELFSGSYNDLTDKPTIPSTDGLATTDYVDNAVSNVTVDTSNLVTDEGLAATLSDYAKSADITEYDDTEVKESIKNLTDTKADKTELDAYVTDTELTDKGYVTETFVTNKIAEAQLDGSEIDLTGLATKDELALKADKTEIPDVSGYALKTEIPSTDGLVTEENLSTTLADYAKSEDLPSEYDDTALSDRVTTTENAITTLNGTGEGSVSKTVDDALNKFATELSDDGVVNTYKELVDYAANHSSDVAEMVADIAENTTAIEELNTKIADIEIPSLDGYAKTEDIPTVTNDLTDELKEKYDKAEENVQSDWEETDETSDAFIKNKPTIPSTDGLATETFVTDKIAEAQLGGEEVDLSGYVKTETLADYSTTAESDEKYVLDEEIETITAEQIEELIGLSADEITNLASLLSDQTIELSKTWSSSCIYGKLNETLDSAKAYTLQELSKAIGASYKVVTSTNDMTSDKVLYLLKENDVYNIYIYDADTSAVELIGSFEVSLDDFYTKTESEDLFATKVDVTANYATKNEVANTYATKEELADAIDEATGTDLTQFAKVSDLEDGTITVGNSKKLNGLTKDELFAETNNKIKDINNNLTNYLPLTGGTLSGDLTIANSGTVYIDGINISNFFTKSGSIDSLCDWYSDTADSTYTATLGDISKYKYIFIAGIYGDTARYSHLVPTAFINLVCKNYQLGYTDKVGYSIGEVTFAGDLTNISVTLVSRMSYAPIKIIGVY